MEHLGMGMYKLMILIPQLIILAACIYYVVYKKSIDGILMTTGVALHLLTLFITYYISLYGYFSIMQRLSFVGLVLFGIGLFMMVINVVKK